MNMKKMKPTLAIPFAALVGMLAGAGVLAQDVPGKGKIEGEVVQLMQQTRSGEAGNLDAVMIRTREGKRMRLLLGERGSCEGCVQVGDQVRARLSKSGSTAEGYQVRAMKVERTGEKTRFRDASGDLLKVQSRDRMRDGTGLNDRAQSRDRINQPGAGSGGSSGGHSGGGGGKGGGRR